jgi:hypothetical protein
VCARALCCVMMNASLTCATRTCADIVRKALNLFADQRVLFEVSARVRTCCVAVSATHVCRQWPRVFGALPRDDDAVDIDGERARLLVSATYAQGVPCFVRAVCSVFLL